MSKQDLTPQDAVLAFESVSKSYGDFEAVRDVSFQVGPGEVLGLLGPNGAGKTTLIRILMDILRPTTGRAWLFGEPLVREALDRVGYLPEERGLYTKLKVIDVMVYFGALKGLSRREAKRRSLEWLERVELPDVALSRVERLSKGMGQKVQIASTLLADPELCVLDEPFSGLDPVNVQLIKAIISERRSCGQTTILSTHQMNMVEQLCDRVALIHRGQLVVYGDVAEVRERYTPLAVEVCSPTEPPAVTGVESIQGGDGKYSLSLAEGTRPARVLEELVNSGLEVREYRRILASMEDIFVEVVGGGVVRADDVRDDRGRAGSQPAASTDGAPSLGANE